MTPVPPHEPYTGPLRLTVNEAAGRIGCPRSWLMEVIAEGRVDVRRDRFSPAMVRASDIAYLRAMWAGATGEVEVRG